MTTQTLRVGLITGPCYHFELELPFKFKRIFELFAFRTGLAIDEFVLVYGGNIFTYIRDQNLDAAFPEPSPRIFAVRPKRKKSLRRAG